MTSKKSTKTVKKAKQADDWFVVSLDCQQDVGVNTLVLVEHEALNSLAGADAIARNMFEAEPDATEATIYKLVPVRKLAIRREPTVIEL